MNRRPRRNHSPAFKAKVALAAIKGDERWPNWRSISMFTPTRSRHGNRSSKVGLPTFSGPAARRPAAGGRPEVAARQDRRARAGE